MNSKLLASAGVLSACLVVFLPGAAFAQSDAYARLLNGDCGGSYGSAWAYFRAQGEVFSAYDNCQDNHSAVTEWKVGSGGTVNKLWDHSGAGGGDEATLNATITDGQTVYIKACIGEYSTKAIIQCTTNWADGVA